jgi:nucleotide-binding universal stress UspA family protein
MTFKAQEAGMTPAMSTKRVAFIIGLTICITVLHYTTPLSLGYLHVLFRELYFIPIILAGLWGGKRWGLTASICITILYIPHALMLARPRPIYDWQMMMNVLRTTAESMWGNIFELLLYNLTGFLSGAYSDLKTGYGRSASRSYQPKEYGKGVLLYVEDSPVSLYAAKYFADLFGASPDVNVTIFWVSTGIDPDFFATQEESSEAEKAVGQKGQALLTQVKQILMNGGIPEERIVLKTEKEDKKSKVSDKILQEVDRGEYGTIVVGSHNLNRQQEFLFGSTAVNLVRRSPANVLTVKAPEEQKQENASAN